MTMPSATRAPSTSSSAAAEDLVDVIEEGHAVVTIGRKGVGNVGEHDVVGERGVLLDTVRAATVTAMAHMITYAISRERLRSLVDGDPAVREWMLAEMRRRYPQLG